MTERFLGVPRNIVRLPASSPEMVANAMFGGAKFNRLFICGTTSLYSIYVIANGPTPG